MKRLLLITGGLLLVSLLLTTGCKKKPTEEALFTKAKTAQEARDFKGAVQAYKDVVASYPTGKKADEAQFMIGFLYANDIGDTAQARQAYETFLTHYAAGADSGMVLSAKWELSNLGKDVDQIEQVMQFAGQDTTGTTPTDSVDAIAPSMQK